MTKLLRICLKSPAIAGLFIFCLFLLAACETPKSPDQVTMAFWQAMVNNDVETAQVYATEASRALISADAHDLPENAAIETGRIVIDGQQASVETFIRSEDINNSSPRSFSTALRKENEKWKVDFQQTVNSIPGHALGQLFKSLIDLGEDLNKQLEEQLPEFEKGIESFGRELEKQLNDFKKRLEKTLPPDKYGNKSDSI